MTRCFMLMEESIKLKQWSLNWREVEIGAVSPEADNNLVFKKSINSVHESLPFIALE